MDNDVGNLSQIQRAACGCDVTYLPCGEGEAVPCDDAGNGPPSVTCGEPEFCQVDPATGDEVCVPHTACLDGSVPCNAASVCRITDVFFWDWPVASTADNLQSDIGRFAQTHSLREGVVWRFAGGKTSGEVDTSNIPEVTEFDQLSFERGVSFSTEVGP